jgi:CubicO group peptidase (beta-lactamase class C family)
MEFRSELIVRGAASAAIGALLGIILNQIDLLSLAQDAACSASEFCRTADPYAEIEYVAEGIGAGVLVTVAVCWVGFAVARLRPLAVSVPSGIVLAMITAEVYAQVRTKSGSWHVDQPELGPGWVVSVTYAGVFMALALGMTLWGRMVVSKRGDR